MSSSSIQKQFILYRGSYCLRDNWPHIIKYGLHPNFLPNKENYSSDDQKLYICILRGKGKKIISKSELDYRFEESDQYGLVRDFPKGSGIRRFKLNFLRNPNHDHDFYKSFPEIDSQETLDSEDDDDGDVDSINELDLALQSSFDKEESIIINENIKTLKKILFSRFLKKPTHLSLNFEKINPYHNRAFQWLPLLGTLENCHIKFKIRSHQDLSGLRDLFQTVKQRNCWPNMKSMVLNLRHSYNRGNCNLKFLRFCKIFQEIAEIALGLRWIRIKLKIKYMWRLNEYSIQTLQESLEKAENQVVKLSPVTNQPKHIHPLFKTIEGMNSLQISTLRFKSLKDLTDVESLEDFLQSLKRVKSLKNLKIDGKSLLDQHKNTDGELFSTEKVLQNLKDFSNHDFPI